MRQCILTKQKIEEMKEGKVETVKGGEGEREKG